MPYPPATSSDRSTENGDKGLMDRANTRQAHRNRACSASRDVADIIPKQVDPPHTPTAPRSGKISLRLRVPRASHPQRSSWHTASQCITCAPCPPPTEFPAKADLTTPIPKTLLSCSPCYIPILPYSNSLRPCPATKSTPAKAPERLYRRPASQNSSIDMALKLDSEVQEVLAPMMGAMANLPKLEVGDVEGKRRVFGGFLEQMFGSLPAPSDVATKDYHTTTSDGHSLLLRWITKTTGGAPTPTPAVVYAHGGGELPFHPELLGDKAATNSLYPNPGMIMANIEIYNPVMKVLVSLSGVPFLAVEFRSAPEVRTSLHNLSFFFFHQCATGYSKD